MTELEQKINTILQEKQTKLLPENIKKDVTLFGITGTLETGGTPINNQDKIVIPTIEQQTITADDTYTGLGTVTIEAVTSTIDENLKPENIKSGITILGVAGIYTGES